MCVCVCVFVLLLFCVCFLLCVLVRGILVFRWGLVFWGGKGLEFFFATAVRSAVRTYPPRPGFEPVTSPRRRSNALTTSPPPFPSDCSPHNKKTVLACEKICEDAHKAYGSGTDTRSASCEQRTRLDSASAKLMESRMRDLGSLARKVRAMKVRP